MKANLIKKTLIERIIDFMSGRTGGVATLKEIYSHIKNDFINLFKETDIMFINSINLSEKSDREILNTLFEATYNTAYEKYYKRLKTALSEEQEQIFLKVSDMTNKVFIDKLPNKYIRSYYKNYVIETEDFAKYMIKKESCKSFDEIKSKAIEYIDTYLNLVSSHNIFKDKNIINVKTMILQLLV